MFFLSVHVSRSGKYYFVKLSRCRSKKKLALCFVHNVICVPVDSSIIWNTEILKSTSTGGFNLLGVTEYCSLQKVCFSILIRNTATLVLGAYNTPSLSQPCRSAYNNQRLCLHARVIRNNDTILSQKHTKKEKVVFCYVNKDFIFINLKKKYLGHKLFN